MIINLLRIVSRHKVFAVIFSGIALFEIGCPVPLVGGNAIMHPGFASSSPKPIDTSRVVFITGDVYRDWSHDFCHCSAYLADSVSAYSADSALQKGRSKASIMRVVMVHLVELKREYDKVYMKNSREQGRVTIKFAIDQTGRVIGSGITQSEIKVQQFEEALLKHISCWRFGSINAENDTTEVVYPFVFSR